MTNDKQPIIDWGRFGADVAEVLDAEYASRNKAATAIDGVNRGMISRATSAQPVSVASYLLLCQACGLDPYAYFQMQQKQAVTVDVPRETFLGDPSNQAFSGETLARRDAPRAVSESASVPRIGSDARSRLRVNEPVRTMADLLRRHKRDCVSEPLRGSLPPAGDNQT